MERRKKLEIPPHLIIRDRRDAFIEEGIISGKGDGLDGNGQPVKTIYNLEDNIACDYIRRVIHEAQQIR